MIVAAFFKDMFANLEENTIFVSGRNKNWFIRPTYKFFFDKIIQQLILSKSSVIKVLKNYIHSSKSKIKSTTSRIFVSNNDRIKQSGFEVQLEGKVGIQFPDDDFTCVAYMAVDAGTNKILAIYFDQGETKF